MVTGVASFKHYFGTRKPLSPCFFSLYFIFSVLYPIRRYIDRHSVISRNENLRLRLSDINLSRVKLRNIRSEIRLCNK